MNLNPDNWFLGDVFSLGFEKYVFQGQTRGEFVGCKLLDVDGHSPGIVDEFRFTREQMNQAVKLVNFVVHGVYASPNQLYLTDVWAPPDSTPETVLTAVYDTCVRDNGFESTRADGKATTWEDNDDIAFISVLATLPGKPVTKVVWSRILGRNNKHENLLKSN